MAKRPKLLSAPTIESVGLPHDNFAEQVALGAIFAADDPGLVFDRICQVIDVTMFHAEHHRIIFESISRLIADGVKPGFTTCSMDLRQRDEYERVFEAGGLGNYIDCPVVEGVESYCRKVAEKAKLRRIYTQLTLIAERALMEESSSDLILEAQAHLASLEVIASNTRRDKNPMEIIEEAGGINQFLAPHLGKSIMTPWPRFNMATNGFRAGQLIILSGLPATGKTAAAGQINEFAAANGHTTGTIALEMSARELLLRLVCGRAGVDSMAVQGGRTSIHDSRRIMDATNEYVALSDKLIIDDSPHSTTMAIRSMLKRRIVEGRRLEMLTVDYLQLCEAIGTHERRDGEINQICRGLKIIAKEFDIPVIALSQVKRPDEKKANDSPKMTDQAEGASIERTADLIITAKLANHEQMLLDERLVDFYITKQRSGPAGKIPFRFHAPLCRFDEIPKERIDPEEYAA